MKPFKNFFLPEAATKSPFSVIRALRMTNRQMSKVILLVVFMFVGSIWLYFRSWFDFSTFTLYSLLTFCFLTERRTHLTFGLYSRTTLGFF